MIIDFHAHIYPEKIARKATQSIADFYNTTMKYWGSPEELLESGKKIGVVHYIVHSTATKAAQVESINNYVIEECKKHPEFVGFGTMHPEYENYSAELKRMKENGLRGVKLHPDFQRFQIDTPEMDPIYDEIAKNNMPILVHAGDCRYDFSGPKRIAHVYEKHPDLIIIAAHFGGYTEWDASMEYLVGKNIYFDTSSTFWKLSYEKANEIIKKHGHEKFLFGSDYPMWDHEEELARFNKLDLTEQQKNDILYNNAARLLGYTE